MSKFAWVTLTTNDTYSLGALVLAHSLKRAGTTHQLAVLVTPGVSESMRSRLKDVYNVVQEVNVLDSQDAANLALLARPELGITFTKLHCWRLVQFEKCVFLDSDTLVLQNCDELFEREELSAAPDVSWPDCFNSGVFVFKPSLETFAKITQFALEHGSFDGGDQGLLNSYFADWAHTDIQKHLPFVYNVTAYASYCYLPAFKQFRDKIKILHFAGKMKPWLIQFNSESKTACTPTDYAHASDLIQLWWNIFCDNVHQQLTDQMQQQEQQRQHQQYEFGLANVKDFHDPWKDYYEKIEKDKNANANDDEANEMNENEFRQKTNEEINRLENVEYAQNREIEIELRHEMTTPPRVNENAAATATAVTAATATIEAAADDNFLSSDITTSTNEEIQTASSREDSVETTTTFTQSIDTNDTSYSQSYSESCTEEDSNEAGLAGALSQLRLGEQRNPEQEAYEQLMRRQCWESGQVDYSGRDSFDNIWKKITETLETKPTTKEDDKSGSS